MNQKSIIAWLVIFFGSLIWSAYRPHDYFTWFLEVIPAILALIILMATYKRFPLTPLSYWVILIHCIILMVGGHYTYSRVPLFDWLSAVFDWGRNNYDKVGHFAQGFIPAIIIREILIRKKVVQDRWWLFFIVVSVTLAFSAFYEIIEWWTALASGTAAKDFLGTQGYVWDTQTDMFMAFIGAIIALLTLSKYHNSQLKKLIQPTNTSDKHE